ncbi:MAG: sugar ABC transporter permease [Clostridia bacterium]
MKKTKALSMLLASSMILATLSACGSTDSTTNSTTGSFTADPSEDRGMNTSGENAITFPLEEPLSYSFHYHAANKYTFNEDWPVFDYLAELTNISFVGTANPVSTSSTTELALQAVDQFPSDLYGGNAVAVYAMSYGPYGAFYSLDDYWEYLPNYAAYLTANPDVLASTVGSDGKLYHIPYIADGDGAVARAYHIRQDWLDNLGLDMPETVEDLEKVLIAFRDDDPNGNGIKDEIPFFNDGWEECIRLVNFWDARCYASDNENLRIIPDENGEWYYTWTSDQFKTAIENVSRWYDIGLIDSEIFTKGTASRKEYLPGDIGGMTYDWIPSTTAYNDIVQVEGFNFVVMAPPVTEAGNQWSEHVRVKVKEHAWAISSSCDPEKVGPLFAFMDYYWSEEGRIVTNFGIEGEHWNYVDGEPVFTDAVLNNPDQKAVNTYLQEDLGTQIPVGYWMDYRYEIQWTHPIGVDGIELYTAGGFSDDLFMMPNLTYTEDELELYDSLLNSIITYGEEAIQDFIIGDWTAIDGKWDAYVEKTESLGLQELIDLTDVAYTRFMSYTTK